MIEYIKGLNPILLAFIATLFTYSVTAIGAALVFIFKKINKNIMDAMLGFAAGVMIAASYFSLLSLQIAIQILLYILQCNRLKLLLHCGNLLADGRLCNIVFLGCGCKASTSYDIIKIFNLLKRHIRPPLFLASHFLINRDFKCA